LSPFMVSFQPVGFFIFISALVVGGTSQTGRYPSIDLSPLGSASHCMIQVEAPARGRVLVNTRVHETIHNRTNHRDVRTHRPFDGRATGSVTKTFKDEADAEAVALGVRSVLLSLWSRCHLAVKSGPEGPMIGTLCIISMLSFAFFTGLTWHFTRGSKIRDKKKESLQAEGRFQQNWTNFAKTESSRASTPPPLTPPREFTQQNTSREYTQQSIYLPRETSVMQNISSQRAVMVVDEDKFDIPPRECQAPANVHAVPMNVRREDPFHAKREQESQQVSRSLGYNWRMVPPPVDHVVQLGGTVPDRASSPPSTTTAIALPTFSGQALQLPPLDISRSVRSPPSSATHKGPEYHSIGTVRQASQPSAETHYSVYDRAWVADQSLVQTVQGVSYHSLSPHVRSLSPVGRSLSPVRSLSPGSRRAPTQQPVTRLGSLSPGSYRNLSMPPGSYHSRSIPTREMLYRSI